MSRAEILEVACPECSATSAVPCTSVTGQAMWDIHTARLQATVADVSLARLAEATAATNCSWTAATTLFGGRT